MIQLDRAEAERLVNTYSDLILRLSYTYLKNTQDAEDICQTVFLNCSRAGSRLTARRTKRRGSFAPPRTPARTRCEMRFGGAR